MTEDQKSLYQAIVTREISILESEYNQLTWRLLLNKLHLILEVFDNPLLLTKREYDDPKINSILKRYKI